MTTSRITRQTVTDLAKGTVLLSLVIAFAVYLSARVAAPERITLGAAHQYAPTLVEAGRPEGRAVAPLPVSVPFISYRLTLTSAVEAAPQTDFERRLVMLLNADRELHGLPPLEFDPALLPLARTRATDQLSRAYLSHHDNLGRLAFATLLAESKLTFKLAGENLARLPDVPTAAEAAQQALMNSPTHRKNILEPVFNRVAIGASYDNSGRVAFAQLFRSVS